MRIEPKIVSLRACLLLLLNLPEVNMDELDPLTVEAVKDAKDALKERTKYNEENLRNIVWNLLQCPDLNADDLEDQTRVILRAVEQEYLDLKN